jgi:hypothetical protein
VKRAEIFGQLAGCQFSILVKLRPAAAAIGDTAMSQSGSLRMGL